MAARRPNPAELGAPCWTLSSSCSHKSNPLHVSKVSACVPLLKAFHTGAISEVYQKTARTMVWKFQKTQSGDQRNLKDQKTNCVSDLVQCEMNHVYYISFFFTRFCAEEWWSRAESYTNLPSGIWGAVVFPSQTPTGEELCLKTILIILCYLVPGFCGTSTIGQSQDQLVYLDFWG